MGTPEGASVGETVGKFEDVLLLYVGEAVGMTEGAVEGLCVGYGVGLPGW